MAADCSIAYSASKLLEEIVVQARMREESIQDAPVTVSVFNEAAIENAGINSMRDYAGLIPNVTLVETQNSGFAFINVRGLSQLRNTDPTVAMVVDGVLSTSPLSFSQELFDIQQIEFLKGPQGALYGRNALGGAINIRTKQPTNEFEGMARASGGNGDAWGAQSTISGALIDDKLLGRVSVSYKDSDGWRENITINDKADPYKDESARVKLLWYPTEKLTADFRLSYSETEGASMQFVSTALAGVFNGVQNPSPDSIFPPGHPLFVPTADPNDNDVDVQGNIRGFDLRESTNISIKLDWETSIGTITSITGWDKVDHIQAGEQAHYTSTPLLINAQDRELEALSQEIRITSPEDQALRWIAGAYMVQTDRFVAQSLLLDNGGGNPSEGTIPKRSPLPNGPDGDGVNASIQYNADDNDNFAYALFAQFNYDLTDKLELSLAARYDNDEREQTVKTPDAFNAPITVGTQVFSLPGIGTKRDETFESFQPKLTLRYQPTEEITLYGTYSKGFRSGGFNPSGSGIVATSARTGPPPNFSIPLGVSDIYEKEETSNIELGGKFIFLDGRLIANVAIFSTDVDDQQLFNFITEPLNKQIIRNIDEVSIQGIEFDTKWAVTDNLVLMASYGLIDSEIEKFNANPSTKGNKAPLNPEDTLNLGFQYDTEFSIGGVDLTGYIRIDYQRLGETWWEPENHASRDPVELWNGRLGFNTADDKWAFAFWIKNATNENYFAEVTNPPSFNYYAPLKKYGAELTYRF